MPATNIRAKLPWSSKNVMNHDRPNDYLRAIIFKPESRVQVRFFAAGPLCPPQSPLLFIFLQDWPSSISFKSGVKESLA